MDVLKFFTVRLCPWDMHLTGRRRRRRRRRNLIIIGQLLANYYLGRGKNSRRYIFLWVVGAESFKIIWVIGVRPNLITWVPMVCVSLRGRGRKERILSANKGEKFLSNLAKKHSRPQRKRPFMFMPNCQNSDVSVEYW